MLFRRTPKAHPPIPDFPEFDRPAVVAGLRALADDIEAGKPCGLVMINDPILDSDTLAAYPADPDRRATA